MDKLSEQTFKNDLSQGKVIDDRLNEDGKRDYLVQSK
jgi:hypothetical protein